ncbi:MAG TPA: alkaline phosphatase family protein [Kofleriaceae bacterium]|nr:alkaline phosphatase family protein [Kofleriaceae bacterium]
MRRRDALKSIGALAGAGAASRLLLGCGDNLGAAADNGGNSPDAGGNSPDAGAPDAAVVRGISTIVVVMMENRSYDHFLGARGLLEGLPGDGLVAGMANPDVDDTPIAIYRETDYCIADPPHSWNQSRVQWNEGGNDGFVRAYRAAHDGEKLLPYVMGHFARPDIPLTWALADAYASCDRWFSSLLGPTWPNRMYLHSGQSGGLMANTLPPGGFDWPAIQHQMTDAGVPWAYYYNDLPFLPLFHGLPSQGFIKRFTTDFFDDAAAGTLPAATFIDPGFTINDDHPPHHPIRGQAFLASVYAALAASPQWNNSLLVITYDEAGGFFDHVSPPLAADDRAKQGFDQLGFRVPTVVAGPYVKQGHVSSVVRDHTSVLAHMAAMFGLEPLTARVAAAADLSELLDAERLAAFDPAPPAEVPAIEVDESTIEAECAGDGPPNEQTDLERLADSGFFAPGLDRRSEARDILYGIGDALERLNAGRIRRRR